MIQLQLLNELPPEKRLRFVTCKLRPIYSGTEARTQLCRTQVMTAFRRHYYVFYGRNAAECELALAVTLNSLRRNYCTIE